MVVDYRKQRDCLRLDFDFTCVYCLSHEAEVSPGAAQGGFEIEHHRPVSKFRRLRHRYDNLLWSCRACNQAKTGSWPSPQLEQRGFRLVDPSQEGLGKHIERSGSDQVVAKTPTGRYIIRQLDLNSELHRARRTGRNQLIRSFEQIAATIEVLDKVADGIGNPDAAATREGLAELRLELDRLREQVYPPVPFDSPATCRCKVPPGRIERYIDNTGLL